MTSATMALGHPPLCPLRKAAVCARSGLPGRLLRPLAKGPAPLRTVPHPRAPGSPALSYGQTPRGLSLWSCLSVNTPGWFQNQIKGFSG